MENHMTDTPANVQAAGEAAVRLAAEAARGIPATFRNAVDFAKECHITTDRIWEIAREAGLDDSDVRALLDGGAL